MDEATINDIIRWAGLIRDVGLILGVPALIYLAKQLHDQHVQSLNSQIELLRQTQYDRVASLIESLKKVYLLEREVQDKRIADLEGSRDETNKIMAEVSAILDSMLASTRAALANPMALDPDTLKKIEA